jgi:AcrR family transcriptional regulator
MTAEPMTRAERQQQTRDTLVMAAREVFARDGYHRARLDDIAREAGFSKGAVYSNFGGKADLFLAVVDANLELNAGHRWDPFDPARSPVPPAPPEAEDCAPVGALRPTDAESAVRGSALATLEFIASAAREPDLARQMAARMERMISFYVTDTPATTDDALSDRDRAMLLVALEQGAALLALSGVTALDQRLLRVGLRRILDPRRAADDTVDDVRGGSGLHRQEIVDAVQDLLADED